MLCFFGRDLIFDSFCSEESGVDMVAEVFPADFLDKAGLGHDLHRLLVYMREYHPYVMALASFNDTHESFNARSVHSGNIPHSYAEHVDILVAEHVLILIGSSKEHRTVDLEYTGILMLSGSVSSSSISFHA